jgi:hypothetical protein
MMMLEKFVSEIIIIVYKSTKKQLHASPPIHPMLSSSLWSQKKQKPTYVSRPTTRLFKDTPMASAMGVIVQSAPFWGELKFKSIWNLILTCKSIRSDMVVVDGVTVVKKTTKKSTTTSSSTILFPSIIEHALLSMISARPSDHNNWTLRINNAKYRFSIGAAVMVKHCAALPVDSEFHMSELEIRLFNQGCLRPSIPFIDTFRLACNGKGGLKDAMERRNKVDEAVIASAQKLINQIGGRITEMTDKTVSASKIMERALIDLVGPGGDDDISASGKKKKKRNNNKKLAPGEAEIRKGLRLLLQLITDLEDAGRKSRYMGMDITSFKMNYTHKLSIPALEMDVRQLKVTKAALIGRYKTHGARYAAETMTNECLKGLE